MGLHCLFDTSPARLRERKEKPQTHSGAERSTHTQARSYRQSVKRQQAGGSSTLGSSSMRAVYSTVGEETLP